MARKVRVGSCFGPDAQQKLMGTDHTCRGQERSPEAHRPRASHHARLQRRAHRRLLWRLSE
jgi:hypothetical protein